MMFDNEYEKKKKNKLTAYLLWFPLGLLGAHKFYLKKVGMGVLYFFRGGLFGIGWIIDVFIMSSQIDKANEAVAKDLILEVKMLTKSQKSE